MTSSPLAVSFLWVSASPRAEPSTASSWKTTTHLFLAAPPPGFGAYLNIQKYKQDCSDLRKIVDLRLGGDISFSLLSFSKLSVSKMEDAAHDTEQVLGKTANV